MSKPKMYGAAVPAGFFAQFIPILPLVCVALVFVLYDCWTAWRLSRRVRKKTGKQNVGKLESDKLQRAWQRTGQFIAVLILAHLLETQVLTMLSELHLANWVTGIFCVVQAVSILENMTSSRDNKFSEILQTVLVDKSIRHLDLSDDAANAVKQTLNNNVNGTEQTDSSDKAAVS